MTVEETRQKLADLAQQIRAAGDGLDPSAGMGEQAKRAVSAALEDATGLDYREAVTLINAIYWAGWNEGWGRGYPHRNGTAA